MENLLMGSNVKKGDHRQGDDIWGHLRPSSRRRYRDDWNAYRLFCEANGCVAAPASAETILAFLKCLFDRKESFLGIRRKLTVVARVHLQNGHEDPRRHSTIREAVRKLRLALPPAKVTKPLLIPDLKRVVDGIESSKTRGIRDKAILLLAFGGALTPREVAELRIDQIRVLDDGLNLNIEEGRTAFVGPGSQERYCVLNALNNWFAASAGFGGSVFHQINRGDNIQIAGLCERSIRTIINYRIASAGLDGTGYTACSPRAGHIAEAIRAGINLDVIMRQAGLGSISCLRPYVNMARHLGMANLRPLTL